MTLLETTEPLFQYVCRLSRVARKSSATPSGTTSTGETSFFTKGGPAKAVSLEYAVVRSDIKALIEDMHSKAAKDFRLKSQVEKVELPLVFCIDSLIAESSLKFAGQWNQNRLAYEKNELAGDEKFFDLLDADLKDPGEEASERLAVYYICIGLGFSGIYFKQPELLRKQMLTIAPRIKRLIDADETARICADAYEAVDARDLTEPPSRKVFVIGMVFLSLAVAALISYLWLYKSSFNDLNSAFDAIKHQNLSK